MHGVYNIMYGCVCHYVIKPTCMVTDSAVIILK